MTALEQYLLPGHRKQFEKFFSRVFGTQAQHKLIMTEDKFGISVKFLPGKECEKAVFVALVQISNMKLDPATEATQEPG